MPPGLDHLVQLQAVDLRLIDLRDRLAQFPARIAEVNARVEAARGQIAAAREAHVGSLKDRKKYELDVDQWKERAQKYKTQSFEVKTNEAYRALQHEIQNAEGEVGKAEDRLLERMVSGEEYERQMKAAERALAETDAAAAAERREIEAEQAATQKELEAAEAERAEAAAGVPEDLLDQYQRIARAAQGHRRRRSLQAELRAVRRDDPAARDSSHGPGRHAGNLPLRDLHAHSLSPEIIRRRRCGRGHRRRACTEV